VVYRERLQEREMSAADSTCCAEPLEPNKLASLLEILIQTLQTDMKLRAGSNDCFVL